MDEKQRFDLIKRNTQEIVSEEELKELLKKKRKPVVYLGTAVTGRPHIAYFVWVIKLADFIKAGFRVKVLLADIHGALDNTPWDVLEQRYKYYSEVIKLMFKAVEVSLKDITIIKGSDFQLRKDYIYDVLRMSTISSIHDCQKASSEVVKSGDNPKLAGLIYPIMQSLDEEYLGVDVQLGGADQRKIFMFARENLPKLGYNSRIEVMNPMVPGLVGKKMSSSDERTKVDLLDDASTIMNKINGAYCVAGELEDNGIMAFLKQVIMVLKSDKGEEFVVKRAEQYGGNLVFKNYEEIEKSFMNKELHPLDLKKSVAEEIVKLLEPFSKKRKDIEKISNKAYS